MPLLGIANYLKNADNVDILYCNSIFEVVVVPIYEYACAACGHTLEKLQKMSDAPLKDCPECGEPSLEKQISAVGFRLSGSGWYETDFKSANQKNLAGKGGDSKKEKTSSATDKKDKSSSKSSVSKAD